MLGRSKFGAMLLVLGWSALGLSEPAAPTPADEANAKRIGALIHQLGSAKFPERNSAQKELEAIGAPALEQLKKSLGTGDLETSKRAGELVRKIEERVFTAGLLAPKRVHLHVTDTSALDAVSELAKQSGYAILVLGDRTRIADRKITLDTGEITFWETFDTLCTQAGLVEQVQVPSPPAPGVTGAAVVQFQIQGQPWQAYGVQPGGGQAGIALLPGTPKNQQLSHAGSVRSRLYALPRSKGEHRLALEASAEPRLQGFTIVGTPTIEKAIDDQGQNLLLAMDPVPENNANVAERVVRVRPGLGRVTTVALAPRRQLTLRFKPGDKSAKSLRELAGSFTAQVIAPPEALITMPNVLKSAGESVQGKNGGTLKLNSIDKLVGGNYKLQIYMENPPGPGAMGGMLMANAVIQMQQVQVQVGAFGGPPVENAQGLPELVDAKGNKFKVVQVPARRMNVNNAGVTQELTIIYRGQKDQGEPDRLIVHGTRTVNVTMPFAFKNVALD